MAATGHMWPLKFKPIKTRLGGCSPNDGGGKSDCILETAWSWSPQDLQVQLQTILNATKKKHRGGVYHQWIWRGNRSTKVTLGPRSEIWIGVDLLKTFTNSLSSRPQPPDNKKREGKMSGGRFLLGKRRNFAAMSWKQPKEPRWVTYGSATQTALLLWACLS